MKENDGIAVGFFRSHEPATQYNAIRSRNFSVAELHPILLGCRSRITLLASAYSMTVGVQRNPTESDANYNVACNVKERQDVNEDPEESNSSGRAVF